MRRAVWRLLLLTPMLVLLVVFALGNTQPLRVVFWPGGAVFEAPASIGLLAALGIGMVLGALMIWLPSLSLRYRLGRAERARDMLDAELRRLKARAPGTSIVLPPPE